MFFLQLIKNFIQILRSGQTPRQVAAGFALGSMVGLMPFFTLQGPLVWLVILLFDVNLSAAILSATLFTLVAYLFDPVFHALGYLVLTDVSGLHGLWTSLYNAPIAPLTRFNNTVVLGSLLCSFVLLLPIYFGMTRFVLAYRAHLHTRIEKWKIYQVISKSTLVRWYDRVKNLGS
ncbi:MAG: TIGR03546 family protein [Ignavibacteriales bacterium]|nr:TIGR03546 family protein [Ignavibacteriales bacterium]